MRSQHDIFRTPNNVSLTIEPQPTPDAYKKVVAEKTMPMWRVQTEGYTGDTDQLIGLVSRDKGFLDSPDTEWISSGVNSKNPDAVAIGRHGNFFLWGFAASPTYLTEEAKLVFVNAVHYIQRFDRQAPVARKRPGTSTRDALKFAIDSITEKNYAARLHRHEQFVAEDKARNAKVRARIAAGEKVSKFERQMLDRPPVKPPGRFQYARRYLTDEQWQKVAGDAEAVRQVLTARMPFVYPKGWYSLVIDEDLRELGVANDNLAMLDKAIAAWSAGDSKEAMRGILMRYTDEKFATAAEWQSWLESNRSRLFFTEAGGFKWLVNTIGDPDSAKPKASAVRAVDGAAQAKIGTARAVVPLRKPTAENPLASGVRLEPLAAGGHVLVVDVSIFKGWHAYDVVAAGSPYTVLAPKLRLPDGIERVGAWQRPTGKAYPADPNVTVFDGTFSLRCKLAGCTADNQHRIVCELSYQVCDENMCQAPTSVEMSVKPSRQRTTSSVSR